MEFLGWFVSDAPTNDNNNDKVVTNSLPIVPKRPSFGKLELTFFVKKTYVYGLFPVGTVNN
ncbi:hypothetical protein J22TS3_49120 [Paenibacillus sp. J22TS3]|nr:hypothetical protein J22TS3_49120 [Paenibacillus sp. J22TS3]